MAIGVKSGAILMAPALLGWLQYAHGTVGLFASLFVVFVVQVGLASPFVSTPVADYLGIKNGAQTTFLDYIKYSKMFGADPVTGKKYGALFHNSMYWNWITEASYDHPAFCNGLLVLLLGQNVFYFFIRRWCLPQTVTNLLKTFSAAPEARMTHKERRLTIELAVVMFLTGT